MLAPSLRLRKGRVVVGEVALQTGDVSDITRWYGRWRATVHRSDLICDFTAMAKNIVGTKVAREKLRRQVHVAGRQPKKDQGAWRKVNGSVAAFIAGLSGYVWGRETIPCNLASCLRPSSSIVGVLYRSVGSCWLESLNGKLRNSANADCLWPIVALTTVFKMKFRAITRPEMPNECSNSRTSGSAACRRWQRNHLKKSLPWRSKGY